MDSYARKAEEERKRKEGLNPYCSGQWTRTIISASIRVNAESLNPYCSRRWSRTGKIWSEFSIKK